MGEVGGVEPGGRERGKDWKEEKVGEGGMELEGARSEGGGGGGWYFVLVPVLWHL